MIDWKKVSESPVPKDLNIYLGIFEGQFCFLSWWEEDDCFWMQWLPGQCGSDTKLKKEEECKITHWAILDKPID